LIRGISALPTGGRQRLAEMKKLHKIKREQAIGSLLGAIHDRAYSGICFYKEKACDPNESGDMIPLK